MQTLASPPAPSVPPKARRRRWPIVTAIVVVVLVGLFIAADRIAVGVAEDQLAEVVTDASARYDTEARSTEVDVAGFPFLTQALGGTFDGATINMNDLTIGTTEAASAKVKLANVQVPSEVFFGEQARDIVAERVNGSVRLSPQALAELANSSGSVTGLELNVDNGKLVATLPVNITGEATTVTGVVTPTVSDGNVALETSSLTTEDGDVSEEVKTIVDHQLDTVPVPDLPFGLVLTKVDVDRGDVVLTAKARNVQLLD